MKRVLVGFMVAVSVLCFNVGNANAAIVWDWFFLDPDSMVFPTDSVDVGPNDTVVMYSRLFNGFSSDANLVASHLTRIYSTIDSSLGGTSGIYDFTLGPRSQFDAMELAPGEGLNFVFGTLVPSSAPVPFGSYSGAGTLVLFSRIISSSQKSFRINVTRNLASGVIPEPASFFLFGLGFLGLAGFYRRSKLNRIRRFTKKPLYYD